MLNKKIQVSSFLILFFLLVTSLFFYFFPIVPVGFPRLLPEISLSLPAEIHIIKNAFDKNLKNIFFGTGTGTFFLNYSLYRSPLLNQTIFWGTRFTKGYSTFLDFLLTKGLLGGVTLIIFCVLSLFLLFSCWKKDQAEFWEIKAGLGTGLLGIILSLFFYPFNFSLFLLFWFFIGGFFFFQKENSIEIDISSPTKNILINTAFIMVLVFSLILFFSQGKNFLAEIYYWRGLKYAQNLKHDLAINFLQKAINTNYNIDYYWRDLSQVLLANANIISQDPNLLPDQKKRGINLMITQGAEAINRAVSIFPQNVANWNTRGFFYQSLIGIEGAEKIALESYQKAIQLEPTSPYSYGEKGRVYILLAQEFAKKGDEKLQKENLNFAISVLQRALELKPDYVPAHYLLAIAFDQLGETEKAISKLEETKTITPKDHGIAFQLGLLYWRNKEFQRAKQEFETALTINPNYSNARYMLALVFNELGDKERAVLELERVLETNPDNIEVKKMIENLKTGNQIFEGIDIKTFIQEFSPEIKKQ